LLDGRYEVSARIAQGGMAVVYSAFDTRLDRPVAVKVMHPVLAADENFVARFRREAKAAAKLSNPHVVAVTDQGRDGDVIFLVMELIEGHTLREVLRESGRLSAPEALEIMIPVLEALAAAHRAGLIHRDVKPENVLVADDGAVKVGDFGLARAVEASPLTATTGLLLGTVAYLAPEQVARGIADARADVYACGIMLFELLTGKPPFQGPTPLQVAYQHLNENVPAPSSLVADVPKAVDRLVADATARDPAGRPHDATAMLFRTRAVLDRIAPYGSPSAGIEHNVTAPLEIDLDSAEAAALEMVRNRRLEESFVDRRDESFVDGIDDIPDIAFDDDRNEPSHDTQEGPAIEQAQSYLSRRKARRQAERLEKKQQKRARKRPFLRAGRVALALLLATTVAAGLIGWQLAGRRATVPPVIGKSPAVAQTLLRDAHLKPQVGASPVYSETVTKGQVAVADPAPGHRLKRGASVTLALSLGPERYTVPPVTGLKVADALSALRVAHLSPDTPKQAYNDTVVSGAVISIDPAAGKLVKPKTAVTIVVSKGPQPVIAPKITDLTGDAAKAALEKIGLKVTVTQAFSETIDPGIAIGINPATRLHRTQAVTLTVSKGPQFVYIPSNIEDYSPSNAESYLKSLGLKVATFSFPPLDTRIAKASPGGGSSVRLGSTVTLYLY
jgi:eukaryotic-like serine/threonine-protein kinase